MSVASNIVLADAQVVPVNHTFVPIAMPKGVMGYEDRSSGLFAGYNRITMSLQHPAPNRSSATVGNRMIKATIKVSTPILETIGTASSGYSPPPRPAHTPLFEGVFYLPERSAVLDRATLLKYVDNLFANAQVVALVRDLDPPAQA